MRAEALPSTMASWTSPALVSALSSEKPPPRRVPRLHFGDRSAYLSKLTEGKIKPEITPERRGESNEGVLGGNSDLPPTLHPRRALGVAIFDGKKKHEVESEVESKVESQEKSNVESNVKSRMESKVESRMESHGRFGGSRPPGSKKNLRPASRANHRGDETDLPLERVESWLAHSIFGSRLFHL